MMIEQYIKKILNAAVYDVVIETPLDHARLLSQKLQNHVLLKREDLQPVFSFKLRGAYNKLHNLNVSGSRVGVITASAGNHAQGLAYAAEKLGVKALIVMPQTTQAIKVEAVISRGARVILWGDTYDEAAHYAEKLGAQDGLLYIHPYDDPDVIAGQGTIGVEILRQHSGKLDAIFVPVGGGGLLAGVATYVKYVRPEVKIYGVESEDSACLHAALKAGRRVKLAEVGLFVDGVAVAQVGKEPFRLIRNRIDGVITVSTDEICAAIKDIFEDTRSIAEPAGALALAGLKRYVNERQCSNRTLLAIDSGANTNFDRLKYICERTDIGENREVILAVTIPERPGSFCRFAQVLGRRHITEFNYRYSDEKEAQIFVGVQLSLEAGDRRDLIEILGRAGYAMQDMTDNEMAKLHVRYMVGGKTRLAKDEVIYMVEFPERPGALTEFLNRLGEQWNISLFHYRNHGAAYGRVLVGLQVSRQDRKAFSAYIKTLNYRIQSGTDNPAYRRFLNW